MITPRAHWLIDQYITVRSTELYLNLHICAWLLVIEYSMQLLSNDTYPLINWKLKNWAFEPESLRQRLPKNLIRSYK